METYKRGERVKHQTMTEWGLGEVLLDQVGDHVQVIFEDAGLRTFKVGIAPMGKARGGSVASVVPFPRVVEEFLHHFPRGFQGPDYVSSDREYKLEAHRFMLDQLDREEVQKLMSSGDYAVISNRARSPMNMTNLISLTRNYG